MIRVYMSIRVRSIQYQYVIISIVYSDSKAFLILSSVLKSSCTVHTWSKAAYGSLCIAEKFICIYLSLSLHIYVYVYACVRACISLSLAQSMPTRAAMYRCTPSTRLVAADVRRARYINLSLSLSLCFPLGMQ